MHEVRMLVRVMVLTLFLIGCGQLPVSAQDATPHSAETGLPEGVAIEAISFGDFDVFPPTPATVEVIRVEVEPGASNFFPDTDPALGLHVVESGILTLRDFSADFVVTRSASTTTPGTTTREVIPAGTEVTLKPGDSFIFEPFVAGEWANDSGELVVFTVVLITPVGTAPA